MTGLRGMFDEPVRAPEREPTAEPDLDALLGGWSKISEAQGFAVVLVPLDSEGRSIADEECGFCGREKRSVKWLVLGEYGVHICETCIAAGAEMIAAAEAEREQECEPDRSPVTWGGVHDAEPGEES